MDRLVTFIAKIWRLIRGSVVLRFSIFLVTIGASFMVPMLWEALLGLIVDAINLILQREVLTTPRLNSYEPSSKDYIIGCSMMFVGIIIFIYFTNQKLKNFSENGLRIYELLIKKWSPVRDLESDLEKVVIEDVVIAINLLNESSSLLEDVDEKTRELFLEVRKDDFEVLYDKLTNKKYTIGNSDSKKLLTSKVHHFYTKHIK